MSDSSLSGSQRPPEAYPLITVFVPWIGREAFIERTLACLLQQDYPNLEILLSDNSLSPAARVILARLKDDPRVRIIDRSTKRLSAAEHYDACLRDARGEFVMILSDDDLIEPKYVSSMYEAFVLDPAVRVCVGEQIAIGEHDRHLPPETEAARITVYDGVSFFIQRLINPRKLPIITYMSLFGRRADMLEHPYRNYPDGSNSDNYMMLALALSGKVAVSTRKLHYRIYASSAGLSTSFGKLLTSCALFECDAATLLRKNRARVGRRAELTLRALLHVRNSTLMTRRLLSLYRKRLSVAEFLSCLGRLSLYTLGLVRRAADAPQGIVTSYGR